MAGVAVAFEVTKYAVGKGTGMKKLIIHGDPGLRKGGRIEYEDEEYEVFSVSRQGDWHGPDRPQLWCTIGSEDEEETFKRQEYIPMHLDTDDIEAEAVTVLRERAPPNAES
ncbi:hypothetical protein SAMN05443574_101492 [Haloarcula vallismortis]|uniref:Uncharacterized protein n=8 Tax=Haloarcula TaxID=2237 RepID=M0J040_HALVA|nr:hypothetical protein C437_19737 [Haloarcula vallismortis ATCC 29715]SDW14178.1 hypothetical protein SAMN05443574_101492 [Haloarcula vallismortis]